ncbi:hypothetical protein DBR06_SOUSAS3010024, partial [Sousa chinensis]
MAALGDYIFLMQAQEQDISSLRTHSNCSRNIAWKQG